MGSLEIPAQLDNQDFLDLQEHLVALDSMVSKEQQVREEPLDFLDLLVQQELEVQTDSQVTLVTREQLGQLANLDNLEIQDKMDSRDL